MRWVGESQDQVGKAASVVTQRRGIAPAPARSDWHIQWRSIRCGMLLNKRPREAYRREQRVPVMVPPSTLLDLACRFPGPLPSGTAAGSKVDVDLSGRGSVLSRTTARFNGAEAGDEQFMMPGQLTFRLLTQSGLPQSLAKAPTNKLKEQTNHGGE